MPVIHMNFHKKSHSSQLCTMEFPINVTICLGSDVETIGLVKYGLIKSYCNIYLFMFNYNFFTQFTLMFLQAR